MSSGEGRQRERIFRLVQAVNQMDGAYYLWAKRMGAKENTVALVYALSDGKPHSQTQISQEWMIPKTTVNTIVKEMAAQGYLTLSLIPHTREKAVALTEEGSRFARQLLGEIRAAEEKALEKTLSQYGEEFIEALEYFAKQLCDEVRGGVSEPEA